MGLTLLGLATSTRAYTLTQATNGSLIRWNYGQKFFLAGNPAGISQVEPRDFWKAITQGLQQWKRATEGQFDFDYWQGTNPAFFPTTQHQDGMNSIFFASQSRRKTDPNIIGHTQIWFNAESGTLIETDIVLNDVDYELTSYPMDTSSVDSGPRRKVYLDNVITHELGHALGLSHSNSINSSMLYVEFSEQNKLGCDDWSGARHLYPSSGNGTGEVTGTLIGPDGSRIKGAVVTAISFSRGTPIASVSSDVAGQFHFGALEGGDFYLVVDSYRGTPESLPAQFRVDFKNPLCGNGRIPKNFVIEGQGNALKKFRVIPDQPNALGVIHLSCQEMVPEAVPVPAPHAFVDRAEPGSVREYFFQSYGDFSITSLGYLLMSPIKVSLTVTDENNLPLIHQDKKTLYRSLHSKFAIEDEILRGTYFGLIKVRAEVFAIDQSAYPSPAILPDRQPDYLILFNDHPEMAPISHLPRNARCESDAPYSEYQSPAGNPPFHAAASSSRDPIGFCGTAQASSLRPESRLSPSKTPLFSGILGWFFPFWVAIVCQLYLMFRRARIKA